MSVDEPKKLGETSEKKLHEFQDAKGRFKPGNKAGGSPVGSRHKATVMAQSMIDGRGELIVGKLLAKAEEGDPVALRLVVERLLPPRKVAPFKISLPPVTDLATAREAVSYVLDQQCQGEITSEEAEGLLKTVEGIIKITQIADLEARVDKLEIIRTVIDGSERQQS
jgi:hypothetical protein